MRHVEETGMLFNMLCAEECDMCQQWLQNVICKHLLAMHCALQRAMRTHVPHTTTSYGTPTRRSAARRRGAVLEGVKRYRQ